MRYASSVSLPPPSPLPLLNYIPLPCSAKTRYGASDNDDNDGDDGDSDDDGQEQSTRLPSELLGKQNWRLPTNKKTLHGRRLNYSSAADNDKNSTSLQTELLIRQRGKAHAMVYGKNVAV